MHRHLILPALVIVLAACGGEPRQAQAEAAGAGAAGTAAKPTPGSYQEGGAFKAFYGEELHENRIYLFGQKPAYDSFAATHQIDITKAKTFVGEGPNRETVIVQTDKDAPQMTDRVYQQFKKRYGLN
jgi:hypothetical protein